MGKSPRTSQGRSIARRMESSGGRRKQKGDGLVPGSKHAGLFSDDAIASFDELLNSDDVAFRTAPGPPVRRAPPPEPDSTAAAAGGGGGTPSWIPSALRTASSGRWLMSWINVAMLLVLLLGAGLAYVYVGGSEWTEPAEADMRVADTAGMVELAPAASEPPSAKDIVEEYRRKRLAKEAAEREEREERLAARLAEVANEATTSPAPEPAPPAPSLEPEPPPPPPRRAMKPKDRVMKPKSTSTESSRPKSKSAGSETDEERAARYAREDAAREARIRREDEERAARIEEEERAAKARVEELEARARVEELETSRGAAGEAAKPAAVVDAVDYEEEEDGPAPVQQRKEERKKEREEAPAVAGNLGVDYE